MTIAELIDGLPIELVHGSDATVIHRIVEDSRRATRGCLFAARPGGTTDGRDYIHEAVAHGAVALLVETGGPPIETPHGVAVLAARDVAAVLGVLAERFHGEPSRELDLVGVTGTNGKTTVAHLIHQVLGAAGRRCGLIGTVHIEDGGGMRPAQMTTPPALETSRLLAAMAASGCSAAVLEVSSHALRQGRTAGLHFDVGVFTNLSGDHLDYHPTLDDYADAKSALFEALPPWGVAVVNADDDAAPRMTRRCRANVRSCSMGTRTADCRAEIHGEAIDGVEARFEGPWGVFDARLPLAGRHNVVNALQAAAVCWALGVPRAGLQRALSTCTAPPGRLEPVTSSGDEFSVFVDYAHTDDALANVLRSLRPLVPGHLRVVFGCGGDRDRSKRPRMGRVAAELADELIITSDNPRSEDPRAIMDDIASGVPEARGSDTTLLADRRQAIEFAVERARPGDVVLIAGKGHEPYQIIGTRKRPFDDRQVAAEALARHRAVAEP